MNSTLPLYYCGGIILLQETELLLTFIKMVAEQYRERKTKRK